ncbi:toxin-antitoxin system HicB family antitoxin [Luteipulveratus sp. YIM 133132]|uniref:Toxin-antitoxin system HicB family antitoxin n=1 Tax=Luteipulveratus flavus TaxID=3031728 RepID=A0ABT6C723_9MICO|nr:MULTISPECIES: toxin-antitoxin system HicB family antitoxin [unclassified Luteipulveratus]MDE9365163.1 toxin-antitoxin system HicB family antitoxin [Luteipulveratus sp. YIM 133132]MDF8264501.1 toxin-antitoxin system HicB family antitoxin [Luteipulveratus sp. YIM 133296]
MDITPYVELLRQDLQRAAEIGGDEGRAAAQRLLLALDPSARLALMEAVSQAAAEITAEMPSGSVDVRLNGRRLDFVVDAGASIAPEPPTPPAPPVPPAPSGEEEADGGLARVTLRLPESVKKRAEERAAAAGQSLNTWLVAVVRAAAQGDTADPRSASFDPFARHRDSRRMSGWL